MAKGIARAIRSRGMRRKLVTPRHAPIPATRVAWWAAFLTTLVLIFGLTFIRSAKAAILPPVGPVNVPGISEEEEEGGDEEEIEAEECEAAEEGEDEEEVEEACEGDEGDSGPPPECFLSAADAAVIADLAHDKLRLAIRYAAYDPATVAVDYSLRGGKGSLNLDGDERHFGRSGVFRATQSLTDAEAKRVAAAKTFTVTVHPVNAPRACNSYLDQHLSVKRAVPGGAMWVDDESTFRRSRRH
ncbi:MAG: hypothetical protein QOE56_613 [Solirubrobacterales bacterium]|nr:hypothetical protein [Solirubrobacterales bacterium]